MWIFKFRMRTTNTPNAICTREEYHRTGERIGKKTSEGSFSPTP